MFEQKVLFTKDGKIHALQISPQNIIVSRWLLNEFKALKGGDVPVEYAAIATSGCKIKESSYLPVTESRK